MRYSRAELVVAAKVQSTVVDYWARVGVLVPSGPAGSYTDHELAVAIVLGEAAHIGAPAPILSAIADALDDDQFAWPDRLVVDAAGRVSIDGDDLAGWCLRPRKLLALSGPQLMLALAG